MTKSILTVKGDTIVIKFDELFKRDLSQYSNFKITKRSYHKLLTELSGDIDIFISDKECLDYAYNLVYFKFYYFKNPTELTIDNVISFIRTKILGDEKLISLIHDEIDSNYNIDVDDSENKNENLQITNEMNKKYLKSSLLMRLLLPIVSSISDLLTEQSELDNYIFEMFTDVMLFFNNEDPEILKKVYNLVSSRIASTRYSDKDIWDFLEKHNKDIHVIVRSFYIFIIVNNFIKIENNKSTISYLDVIIKNKLNFAFRLDYKVSHKTLDYFNISDSSNGNSKEIDRLEQSLLRKDKGLAFINNASVRRKVSLISKSIEETNQHEEFELFKDSIVFNEFTKRFLNMYYNKQFNIKYDENNEYYLLWHMLNEMTKNKCTLVPELLICKETATRINNKRKILERLNETIKYKLLLEKYSSIRNLVNDDINFISDLVIKMKAKQFKHPVTNVEVEIDLDKLNEEVLDFLFMIPNE